VAADAGVPGVVTAGGARLVGADGKVVPSPDRPRLGVSWPGQAGTVRLRDGRGPVADTEIAVDTALAAAAGVRVGDLVDVLTLRPRATFTLVGTFDLADRDQQTVAFTEPVAQASMLGERDAYTSISVTAQPGVSQETLRDRVAAAVGGGYTVSTGRQLSEREGAALARSASPRLTGSLLLGFAGVALVVGALLMLNTLSLLVARRTRELALLRVIGAGRRQIAGTVLAEAALVGVTGSAAGLAAGIGAAAVLARFSGGTGLVVPPAAVAAAFAVGVPVTLVAALIPALRASRVTPLAALRDAAPPRRTTSAWGALVLAAGVAMLWGGPAVAFGGVLVAFTGAALLTPALTRPATGAVGWLFAWSVPGRLGRRNAIRDPRRTAVTATALMIAVALLAGVSTVLVSATGSVGRLVGDTMRADLVISGDADGVGRTGFDPAVLTVVAGSPGVQAVTGLGEGSAVIDGRPAFVQTVTDVPALRDMLGLTAAAGAIGALADDQILVDQRNVTAQGPHVGDRVTVRLPRGAARQFTLAGVYTDTDLLNGWLLPASAAAGFRKQPTQAYVRLTPGTDVAASKLLVAAVLGGSPEVSVSNRAEYTAQQNAKADRLLTLVQLLLALAVLIAVLGVVNTVALSVLERTRELGLLRVVGLRRAQTVAMTAVEAAAVSVGGALLGVLTGVGLGAATVHALASQGVTELTVPVGRLAAYLVLAAVAGVAAALLPAARAARLDVLRAIAHD
jgi:putative ABC transport system permease protein